MATSRSAALWNGAACSGLVGTPVGRESLSRAETWFPTANTLPSTREQQIAVKWLNS